MSDRIKSLDEITDPEGFLNAYYGAMEDAKNLRQANKELQEKADAAGSNEEADKWKSRALKAEAKQRLEADGIKNPDRILKYLNLDGVDFDDDGNLTGFDDKVGEVKNDFPELFDAKRRAGRQSVDIHADKPAETKVDPLRAAVHSALNKQ